MEISSTEAIRKKIISDAEDKSKELIEQARKKAEEILNAAKKRAEEMKKTELDQVKKHVEDSSKQDIAEKKVGYHRRLQTFKSQIIDGVFDKAKEELQRYVNRPDYRETLKNLIIESAVALGGGKLSIRLNETDKKKMSRVTLKKLSAVINEKTSTTTEAVLDESTARTIGGAIVYAVNQQASTDNTLEARLERIKEDSKAELEAILFK
jgi:vacuolar-type H+-ATPase subunit E/Vma4